MTHRVKITTTTEVDLDIDLVAKWFCELDDEKQADFFIAVAAHASRTFPNDPTGQWWFVGKHLQTCSCSTDEARDLVRSLYDGLCRH